MSLFVALDGPDGCGKSVQAVRLVDALRARGRTVVHLREPGSTPFGERVRAVLLDPSIGHVGTLAEALAFSAARRTMLERQVAPALARGEIVVAERCFLSTVVYQCRAPREDAAPEAVVAAVTRAVHDVVAHDLVLMLDVDTETAIARMQASRAPDRIERRGEDFHRRVRQAFVALASETSWPRELIGRGRADAVRVIDAGRAPNDVHADVLAAVDAALAKAGGRA